MTAALTILIVGGYGIFGGRIVALLEDEPQLTLLVGGRSLAKASTGFRRAEGTRKANPLCRFLVSIGLPQKQRGRTLADLADFRSRALSERSECQATATTPWHGAFFRGWRSP